MRDKYKRWNDIPINIYVKIMTTIDKLVLVNRRFLLWRFYKYRLAVIYVTETGLKSVTNVHFFLHGTEKEKKEMYDFSKETRTGNVTGIGTLRGN